MNSTSLPPIRGGTLVLLTLSLSLGVFMNVLDVSIANVAIPPIAGDLGVSPNQGTWVITSFAISTAIMLPLTGWLSQRFGEVKVFVFSTAMFTVASMLCGLSSNLGMLVFFRVLQGVFAGPMIPLSQSILMENFPPEKKGLAIGLWAMTAVAAPVFGPMIGGWITDNYTWPWIFYINLPVGIFSAAVTGYLLRGRDTPTRKLPIDMMGLVLLIIAVGSLQLLLDHGKDYDWFQSNTIVMLGIISFIAFCFLVIWEITAEHPIVDLRLFARRNFLVGTIALSIGYLVFFASIVIFPLWLQTQMGYTPTWAGLAAAPIGLLTLFFAPVAGALLNKVDLRILITISFLIFAGVSFWNSRFNTDVTFMALVEPRLIQGIGIAFFFTPLISLVISGLPVEKNASALGLTNFCRIMCGSFGTSLSVTIWDRREAFHHSQLAMQVSPYNSVSLHTVQQLQSQGFSELASYQQLVKLITNQAYMLSTNDFFWISGWIFLVLVGMVWLAKPPFTVHGGMAAGD